MFHQGEFVSKKVAKRSTRVPANQSEGLSALSTGGGAAAGATSALAGVAAGGVGTGAAALTSGLAAVGGIVGGGMAAGLAVVAAAPVAGAALGFGGYKLFKKLASRR